MKISSRGMVDPFIVMDVMEAARKAEAEGRHIIHMEVGQPGTGAPKAALEDLQMSRSGVHKAALWYSEETLLNCIFQSR